MERTDVRDLDTKVDADEPITMLTAYDAPTAEIEDEAGVDVILVGDSLGDNVLGHETTIPVTVAEMVSHTAAVTRAVDSAMVVADMPLGAYGGAFEDTLDNATRLLKEAGADAVKLETAPGGETTVEEVERLTELGVPVMAHTGLTPQRVNEVGGHVVQGRGTDYSASPEELVATGRALAEAGAFSLVLELVAEPAARRVTDAVDVPTIGIGAGRGVDGQVLTVSDVLGFGPDLTFNEAYADVPEIVAEAVGEYLADVEREAFPTAEHAFDPGAGDGDERSRRGEGKSESEQG
jgi:3-methyl-2-oxobutanoate hydroxymethyltransferase